MSWLTETLIAHRGLFDNEITPENSLKAFDAAAQAGYGIELDVHVSDDGRLMVHHDYSLTRSCARAVVIEKSGSAELAKYGLFGTDERIPFFEETLELIAGRVPLVAEIKNRGDCEKICRLTAEALDAYDGQFAIESFDPAVVSWFFKNRPDVMRGQLAEYPLVKWFKGSRKRMKLAYFEENKPDFIAYCILQAPNRYTDAVLKQFPETELVLWTARTPEQLKRARAIGAGVIFEQSALED